MTRAKSKQSESTRHGKHLFRYESRSQPLLGPAAFAKRMAKSFAAVILLIALSLFVGMLGYRYLEGMPWIDAFVNASMILSGMGPMGELKNYNAKLFAGIYALYSGLAVIVATGVILAPLLHRLLHHFHADAEKSN